MPAIIKSDDYLHNEVIQMDNFLESELLIQEFEIRLSQVDLSTRIESLKKGNKQKIVLLCYDLYIEDTFRAWGADVVIFCKNIYGSGDAAIDVSGIDALEEALAKETRAAKNGDGPDGANADNCKADGSTYAINGFTAGNRAKPLVYNGQCTWYKEDGTKEKEIDYSEGRIISKTDFSGPESKVSKARLEIVKLPIQSFYINSTSNEEFKGGSSRTVYPVELPKGTVEWFYEFTASRNKEEMRQTPRYLT